MPKYPLSLDYVYVSENSDSFRTAKINLSVEDEGAALLIAPYHPMSDSELKDLLAYVDSNSLKKMRLSLRTDCRVELTEEGRVFDVHIDDENNVKERKPRA